MWYCIEVRGVVQGVGFRPFIYRLAHTMGLSGSVSNNGIGVIILIQSSPQTCDTFMEQIREQAPPLSYVKTVTSQEISPKAIDGFHIVQSHTHHTPLTQIPTDRAMCQACQEELNNRDNRRFGYPFISCVDCGPRYSIIQSLPYDRVNTSMAKFPLCKACQAEYNNPLDRRYHAQPIGCFTCGPRLSLWDSQLQPLNSNNHIEKVITSLAEGKIVALKGIGGYHLLCDATNDTAVSTLRTRKQRPSKPFAVMVKDTQMARGIVTINHKEEELLTSTQRPIVLLNSLEVIKGKPLSSFVAPHINKIGLFLAYTPLHYLLLQELDFPLIATSANFSGEPLCSSWEEMQKLNTIWDYCLDHDREIVNRCDDSILFVESDTIFALRLARGYSPSYLPLPHHSNKKILALGANQKSTIALTLDDQVVLSPYIGDLNGIAMIECYHKQSENLKRIYDFKPDIIVCDHHPHYLSTKYAQQLIAKDNTLQLIQVQHHYAHILATMGVNGITSKVLGVSFDGTGYGDDGHLWGGEFMLCDTQGYQRVGHFKYFKLLGGEKAIKEPRRVALSFLFEIYGAEVLEMTHPVTNTFSQRELATLWIAWQKGLNSPLSSSCGRLFDAVASLLDVIHICSYEGESGLMLESFYDESITDGYKFTIENGEIDFTLIVQQIIVENNKQIAISKFFNTLVEIIDKMGKRYKLPIVLGGGVFQNSILLRLLIQKIPNLILPKEFMANDSAIAYGQVMAVYATN